MADGSLKFDTKVDTEGFEEGTKGLKGRLESVISSMKKSMNSLHSTLKGTRSAFDNAFSGKASSKVVDLNSKIQQTENQVKALKAEMEAMANTPFASKEAGELTKQTQKAEQQLLSLLNQREALEKSMSSNVSGLGLDVSQEGLQGLYEGSAEWQKLSEKINQADIKLTQYEAKLKQVQQADSATTQAGTDTYDKKATKLQGLISKLDVYKLKLDELNDRQNKVSSSGGNMRNTLKNTLTSTVPLTKSIFKLSNMFKLMVARMVIRAAIKAIQEGFQNLAQYSTTASRDMSALKTSLLMLKNSFATAFAPILTAVTPILQTLINYLSQAITTIGQFFAAFLNGASTFTKAKQAQVSYGKAVKKSGKEAKRALAPFDELNILSDGSSSGGGAESAGPSPGQMFEDVEIDSKILDTVGKFKKLLEPAIEAFERLKIAIAPFAENVGAGLRWFYDNVLKPLGEWTISELIPAFFDVLGASIGVLNGVLEAAKPMLLWLWNNFLKPLSEFVGKAVIWSLEQIAGALSKIAKNEPLMKILAASLIALGLTFLIVQASALLVPLAIAAIVVAIAFLINNWDKAVDWIVKVWNICWDAIKSFFGSIYNWILQKFNDIGTWFSNVMASTKQGFINAWNSIKSFFGTVVSWLSGQAASIGRIFSGIWDGFKSAFISVWNWVKNAFSNGGSLFVGIKDGIVSAFKSIVNALVSGINTIVSTPFNKVNSLLNTIRNVSVLGITPFKSLWGYSPLPVPKIPKLATGAVIPPNSEFLAILGDQKSGRNIEAPEGLIRKIIREELGSNNGGDLVLVNKTIIEGEEVFKEVKRISWEEFKRTGESPFPVY